MPKYTITSKPGMTPWATCASFADAERESRRARQQGLDGAIVTAYEPLLTEAQQARDWFKAHRTAECRATVAQILNVEETDIDAEGDVWSSTHGWLRPQALIDAANVAREFLP